MTEPDQSDAFDAENSTPRRRTRLQNREPVRDAQRDGDAILGRNGEVLTRRRVNGADEFHIPEEMIPKGWSYQWNTVTVYNNPDLVVGMQMQMHENGWRPVPADRHEGKFMPIGAKGDIIRKGLRLEERPKIMTDQARREDQRVAAQQMTDRDQSLMGGKADLRRNVPGGFEMDGRKYRGTGGDLRMSIDPGLDVPAPSHKIAGADE